MTHMALRLSGLLLMGGAALLGIAIVMLSFKPVINQVFSSPVYVLFLLASILFLLSLPGVYARHAAAAGWLGLAGHALLQTGFVLILVIGAAPLMYPSINVAPGESLVAFVLGVALTLGLLLTGFATLRAGVYPGGSGILLLAATAGFFFSFFIAEFLPPLAGQVGSATFGLLLALALVWIGYSALTG